VLRIAAVIAIVAIGAWGLNLQRQLEAAQRFDRAVAAVVQAAGQPGSKTVILAAGKDVKSSGIGAVGPDGSVVLAMRDLAATSGSQVYETWVIVGSQAPVAVGGFTVDTNGTASFTTRPATTPSGAVIAVTLEPKEGNTAPTGPIVAAGVTTAPPPPSS
jgi:anti-sigma-K factor RskA